MMVRFFYACLLRLHPRGFRQRFGEEMLSIFDEAAGGTGTLLADAVLSVVRQWAVCSKLWGRPAINGSVTTCVDGVPAFYTCGSYLPRASALLNGVVLSIATFGAVCFAIGHGGSHHRFPALVAGLPYASQPRLPDPAPATRDMVSPKPEEPRSRPLSSVPPLSHSQQKPLLPEALPPIAASRVQTSVSSLSDDAAREFASRYFLARPLLAALDADHDFVLSASEIAGAPSALRQLDTNHDGKLSSDECGQDDPETAVPVVFSALDADHDGEISAVEIQNAPAALEALDRNRDGKLTFNEILPPGVPRIERF